MEVFWFILFMCIKYVYNVDVEEGNPSKQNAIYNNFDKDVVDKTYYQILDHFNPLDNRKWFQRYRVYPKYFKWPRKNVFLIIGGHHDYYEVSKKMSDLDWISYGEEFQALCIHLEHRYYGKSKPTDDLSDENLRYLTSHQALADSVDFINFINKEYSLPRNVKWIVFGDQYAGALAIWLRQLYPHLVHGAVSSSGMLQVKLNFEEYYKTIYDILRSHSQACLDAVKNGISQIQFLLRVDESQEILNNLFHPCTPIENNVNKTYDLDYFFYKLSSHFSSKIVTRLWRYDLKNLCQIMTEETTGIEVQRLAKVNNLMLHKEGYKCLKISFDEWIDSNRITNWNSGQGSGDRQWSYQQCTEFGLFTTSDYKPQIFGDKYPLDFFITKCQRIFGPTFDKKFISDAVDKNNFFFGGFNEEVSNVVVVYGSMDIWKPMKVIEDRISNKKLSIIIVNGTVTSDISYEQNIFTSYNLYLAKTKILKLITQWLTT